MHLNERQRYPILSISNLDYKMEQDEWFHFFKKSFAQVSKVLSINFITAHHGCGGGVQSLLHNQKSIIGLVTVSSIADAQRVIRKFHNKKIGYRRLQVNLYGGQINKDYSKTHMNNPPNKEYKNEHVSSLKRQHQSLLLNKLDYSEHECAFEKFSNTKVCIPAISRSINHFNDDVKFNKCAKCKGIRTASLPTSFKVSGPPLQSFTKNVQSLLENHNGIMALSAFVSCYNATFRTKLLESNEGVPLEHYISCVDGIDLKLGNISDNCVTARRSTSAFSSSFSPQAFPVKLIVFKEKANCGSKGTSEEMNLNYRLKIFSKEVFKLLDAEPGCVIPSCGFLNLYHRKFHRQLRVADYGFCKIQELLLAIPNALQLIGCQNDQCLTLPHHVQLSRMTRCLRTVFRKNNTNTIPLRTFEHEFKKATGRAFIAADFGLTSLLDFFYCLNSPQEFKLTGEQSFESITRLPVLFQSYKSDITLVCLKCIEKSSELRISHSQLVETLSKIYGIDFSYLRNDEDAFSDLIDDRLVKLQYSSVTYEPYLSVTQKAFDYVVLKNFIVKKIDKSYSLESPHNQFDKNDDSYGLVDNMGAWMNELNVLFDVNCLGLKDVDDFMNRINKSIKITESGELIKSSNQLRIKCIVLVSIFELYDIGDDEFHIDSTYLLYEIEQKYGLTVSLFDIEEVFVNGLFSIEGKSIICSRLVVFAKILLSIFFYRFRLIKNQNFPPGYPTVDRFMSIDDICVVYERTFNKPLKPQNFGCLSIQSLLDMLDDLLIWKKNSISANIFSLSLPFISLWFHSTHQGFYNEITNASSIKNATIKQQSALEQVVSNSDQANELTLISESSESFSENIDSLNDDMSFRVNESLLRSIWENEDSNENDCSIEDFVNDENAYPLEFEKSRSAETSAHSRNLYSKDNILRNGKVSFDENTVDERNRTSGYLSDMSYILQESNGMADATNH